MAVVYHDPRFLEHETGRHPERPDRLRAVLETLTAEATLKNWEEKTPRSATVEELSRVHDADYVGAVEAFAEAGGGNIDADTVVSPRSYEVATLAAGAACEAVEQVVAGTHSVASCLIRPPGHHALIDRAMGFCLFNSIAVAARHAIDGLGLSRVLVVDFDVHHGNGTQDLFYDNGEITFFSVHRYPFWPGSGSAIETGSGDGLGHTFNLPLEYGISREQYHNEFARMLEDALARSNPELLLVSAGFDAHRDDPIGSLGLDVEDFVAISRQLVAAAKAHCDGKLVSLLEGGYNLAALAASVRVHLEELNPN